jgi:transcriptional regulator with XRE-family HTH domain
MAHPKWLLRIAGKTHISPRIGFKLSLKPVGAHAMMMMIKKAIARPKKEASTRGSRRRAIGLSDYQKQMLKKRREEMGISQSELGRLIAQAEGLDEPIAQSNISNLERIETGKQARLPNQGSRYLPTIERILKFPTGFLRPARLHQTTLTPVVLPTRLEGDHAFDVPPPIYTNVTTAAGAPDMPTTMAAGAQDLPVYAVSYGSDGAIDMSMEAAEYTGRPARLIRVSKGHGIRIIPGFGMEPKYEPGEVIFANPLLPGLPNKNVVLRRQQEGGEVLIRRLVAETATEWTVQQFNPSRTYSVPKAEWPICYRVVGSSEE